MSMSALTGPVVCALKYKPLALRIAVCSGLFKQMMTHTRYKPDILFIMGNILFRPAADKKNESGKKRAREEPVDAVLRMIEPKRVHSVFRFTYPNVPARSGRLDKTTMTIETDDGKKYQTAYRFVGSVEHLEPWAQADLDAMDFETITYNLVESWTRNGHVHFYFEVMCRGVREGVFFRQVVA